MSHRSTDRPAFSWLRELSALRAALAADLNAEWSELRRQARTQPLQGFELELLGRVIRDLPADGAQLPRYRVALVASHTSEPIANALRVALLREGFLGEIYEAPFRSYRQTILDPASALYEFRPDLVLLAISATADDPVRGPLAPAELDARSEYEVASWQALWSVLGSRLGKPVLQHVAESPDQELLGIAERRARWVESSVAGALNARLIDTAPAFVQWVDVDRLAARVGRQNWRDPRLEHHASFAFSPRFLPEYTQLLSAALRGVLGTAKKALVVDLDNTLWGGVIGDDGLEGIRLGPEGAEGAAYASFTRYIESLSQRGVILGICSKNELATATQVFERHPHMRLALTDFASVRCNWQDKASNLREIARELNIDLSAIVFVDDNPAEVELVRQALPEVHCVLLDGDPALFVRKLDYEHLFDAQELSTADLQRAASYQARVQSAALQAEAPDLESYLLSLEMKGIVKLADESDLPRLAQLEMKTNQFNLSTRRLSLDQLRAMSVSGDTIVLAVSLADRFADHGLVSYLAASCSGSQMVITDWLMSCRVFARTLEQFVFNHLVTHAVTRGLSSIEARFTPTAKTLSMGGLFRQLGFACLGPAPEGPWRYEVSPERPQSPSFIAAERSVVSEQP